MRKVPCAGFLMLLAGLCVMREAKAQTNADGSINIPIYATNGVNYAPSHYMIYAGIGTGPILPYLFDTGAPNFFSFYDTNGSAMATNGSFTFSTGLTYYYEGINTTVSLGSNNNAVLATSEALNLAQVRYTQGNVFNNAPINQVTNATAPLGDGTYGDFGAGFYGSSMLATVLTQIPLFNSLTIGYTLNLTTNLIAATGQGSLTLGVSQTLLDNYATNPCVIKMALSPLGAGSNIPTTNGGSVTAYNKAQVASVAVSLTNNNSGFTTNMPLVIDTGGGPNAVLYATNLDAFQNATGLGIATTNGQSLYSQTNGTTPWGGNVDVITNLAGGIRINSGGYFFDSNIVTFDLSDGYVYVLPTQAVPEPSALWLMLAGVAFLLVAKVRAQKTRP